jgi:5-methylcytosine-specific restriction endonuclease McrA
MMEFASEPIPSDNQTVLSDITDNNETNTILSFVIEDKMDEIVQLFNAEVNKLNNDAVKEKAKEVGLSGLSKLKKPEIIQLLEVEFLKLLPALKEKKATDLKNICKCYGIKGVTGVKKDVIIYNMLLYCCTTLTFMLNNTQETEPDVCSKAEPMDLIEQLEKQKMEIETKLKDELRVREEKRMEIEKKAKEEEIRMQEEKRIEELRLANEKKAKDDEEAAKLKEDVKKKKQSIPKNVRIIVWNHYIGEDIIKHRCLCCKKVIISNTNFEVGHVISEKSGGTHEINNLRPICFACNHSMGAENMIDFVVKYGLYIG